MSSYLTQPLRVDRHRPRGRPAAYGWRPARVARLAASPCQSYSPQARNRGPGVLLRRSHQCVAGQGNVKHFARGLGPSDGKAVGIEQTELNEHAGLIPVDVLMHEFV